MQSNKIITGDAFEVLKTLPAESIDCIITSPPYWGLRDYGMEGQLGLEKTPEEYIAHMVEVFAEARRTLKKDGTFWLNVGDSYAHAGNPGNQHLNELGKRYRGGGKKHSSKAMLRPKKSMPPNLKQKDLVGIPWMLAFALRADGWYLRQDIIWSKPNAMPESVLDRCTKSHEYIFLLSKSSSYHFDGVSIREPWVQRPNDIKRASEDHAGYHGKHEAGANGNIKGQPVGDPESGRNKRSVWSVATIPFNEAHFATFPEKLIEPIVMAGCPRGGVVLDPFMGAGTTGVVAKKLGRKYLGIELNPVYAKMAEDRLAGTTPPML